MEEVLQFSYKKPEGILSLVYRELGEAPAENASSITRILWRHGFTLQQVNEALKELADRGKIKRLHNPKYDPAPNDPAWCRVDWFDDEDC